MTWWQRVGAHAEALEHCGGMLSGPADAARPVLQTQLHLDGLSLLLRLMASEADTSATLHGRGSLSRAYHEPGGRRAIEVIERLSEQRSVDAVDPQAGSTGKLSTRVKGSNV
jgi:hypothetical protein